MIDGPAPPAALVGNTLIIKKITLSRRAMTSIEKIPRQGERTAKELFKKFAPFSYSNIFRCNICKYTIINSYVMCIFGSHVVEKRLRYYYPGGVTMIPLLYIAYR